MKTLSSLREKKRYLAFEINSKYKISRKDFFDSVLDSSINLFGDVGSSLMNLKLLSYDGKYGIIRCKHTKTDETRACLACISQIKNINISIRVLGISGTVKGAKSFIDIV